MKRLLLGMTLVVSASSYAGIVDYDDTVANTFYDTDTDLVWLDTRMTGWYRYSSSSYSSSSSGNSYTIEENLARFSDFRIANESEVRTLMENAFTNVTFDVNGNYHYNDSWSSSAGGDRSQQDPLFSADFSHLLAVADGSTYQSSRSYSDGDSSGSVRIDGLFKTGANDYGNLWVGYDYDSDYSRTWFGGRTLRSESDGSDIVFSSVSNVDPMVSQQRLWMVYDPAAISVSEPGTWALLALGFLGLGARRRLSGS